MTPSENWPKTYILKIMEEAVNHGFVYIEPIDEASAKSLVMRVYRSRRRSDKSTASFILPEYHLVTAGRWEPENGGRQPFIFSRLSTGEDLPGITPRPDLAGPSIKVPQKLPFIMPEVEGEPIITDMRPMTPSDLQLDPDEVSNYVESLIKKATGGKDD